MYVSIINLDITYFSIDILLVVIYIKNMKGDFFRKDTKTFTNTSSIKEIELIATILGSGSKKDRELAKLILQKSKGTLLNITP